MTVATATLQRGSRLPALEVLGELLLGWGALSSLLYVGADVLAGMRHGDYGYASQTIGELSAAGAPTRMLAVALALAYGVLVIGFGLGVWESARGKRATRITGALLIAYGAVGLVAPFFPMHARGAPPSIGDALHVALAAVTGVLVLLQLVFGSGVGGKRFRAFSLATFVVVVVSGALAALDGPRIAAGEPTPWIGAVQRACVGAYLLWVAVLDLVLMRAEARAVSGALPAAERVAQHTRP